ncbi:MAG: hypothetical protein LBP72_09495 [Dysgonamonadaceae bacterium]|jgi:hypothetical protein|nr:hypothetical protein [Dysgonamonadaceae bacterium]
MNTQEIKQLLERYWVCKTSLEEEQYLFAFFSGNELPEDMKIYQPLFALINRQSAIKAPKRLINRITEPLKPPFYPAMKIAASVLILLTVGVGFYTHYQQEKQMDRIFTDTCADPQDAVKETERVIAKVSSVLQLIEKKNIWNETLDSVRQEKTDFLHKKLQK